MRAELPLVDQPKVTLHDDSPYSDAPPFTIQLPSSMDQGSISVVIGDPSIALNGGPCNHMGGGEMVLMVNSSGGDGSGHDATIMEIMGAEVEQGTATVTETDN